jgi:hypothetical protein
MEVVGVVLIYCCKKGGLLKVEGVVAWAGKMWRRER